MRLYDGIIPYLVEKHRVIRINWRGHAPDRDPIGDFGVEEQVSDTVSLLNALGVDQFYLVSHSHGGWPALEIADRLGKGRVPRLLMIDQIMIAPPPEFQTSLKAIQTPDTWRAARKTLFEHWLAGSNNKAVQDHLTYCMGSYGFQMWSLSCQVIEQAYQTHGSPMRRMAKMADQPLIRHIFSHPLNGPEYRRVHENFSKEHPWFSYKDLKGETHFPSCEIPKQVCEELEDLITSEVK